jgi:hypothetical protein
MFRLPLRNSPALGTDSVLPALPAAKLACGFQPDAADELNTLGPLQTLLHSQESGFWVAHDEQSIRAFLTWIHSTATFTLKYSDVDGTASIIRRLIA